MYHKTYNAMNVIYHIHIFCNFNVRKRLFSETWNKNIQKVVKTTAAVDNKSEKQLRKQFDRWF